MPIMMARPKSPSQSTPPPAIATLRTMSPFQTKFACAKLPNKENECSTHPTFLSKDLSPVLVALGFVVFEPLWGPLPMPKARHRKFREPCRRVGWISEWRLQAIPAADILPESNPWSARFAQSATFLVASPPDAHHACVAPGRHDGGMSHRLPHGVDVGAGLKELRRKGSTQIMRREGET